MSALPFVRRTALADNESRVNFKQIDNAVISALISAEACKVTAHMSRVYLGLLSAPAECWIRDGVIHLVGNAGETAWQQMASLTGVADATLAKAIHWMMEKGIIGYDARKNGIGIRIWFNRAAESIRKKPHLQLVPPPVVPCVPGWQAPPVLTPVEPITTEVENPPAAIPQAIPVPPQKKLPISPASFQESRTSSSEVAFKEEVHERDLEINKIRASARENISGFNFSTVLPAIIAAIRPEIGAMVRREISELKNWIFNQAIPKAARVAQRETFDCLRAQGSMEKKPQAKPDPGQPRPESAEEGNQQLRKIIGFLLERRAMLEQAAAGVPPGLVQVLRESAEEFAQIAAGVQSPADAVSLDEPIDRIERKILESAWQALDETERSEMSLQASEELESYRHRTQPEIFADMVRRRINLKLRELFSLPKLNLFYIQ